MGKHGPSDIHDNFSTWHWNKCGSGAYMVDLDRIWMEQRSEKPVAIYDLKKETGDKFDPPTWAEIIAADWFEKQGIPYYLVYIRKDFSKFIIYRHLPRRRIILTENEMINWIDSGCPPFPGKYFVRVSKEENRK